MNRFFIALVISLSCARGAELLVAAASDLAPMAPALEQEFSRLTGNHARFTLASSGSLARQVENGAPYDVFLSASEQYVQDLVKAGRVDASTVAAYALGRLGLWSADGSIRDLRDLAQPRVKHVSIANPQHAPYGLAARQVLERQNLWKQIEPKLVYGENVRQALQFAESRNADAVITSWTLLVGRGILLPVEWHDPIRQTAAVVKTSSQQAAAKAFVSFLESAAAGKILAAGGLTLPQVKPDSRNSPPPPAQRGATRLPARR